MVPLQGKYLSNVQVPQLALLSIQRSSASASISPLIFSYPNINLERNHVIEETNTNCMNNFQQAIAVSNSQSPRAFLTITQTDQQQKELSTKDCSSQQWLRFEMDLT
jgi:hypothetical protein